MSNVTPDLVAIKSAINILTPQQTLLSENNNNLPGT